MKKLILTAFALTAAVGVFAQGTVGFGCYNALGTVHFWGPSSNNASLFMLGNGPTDSPAGTNDYVGRGMALIGANGTSGKYGSSTTLAQLL